MIGPIVPASAVAAELFTDEAADLFPEEQAAIAGAVGKRRREFTSVRVCARRALAALGRPPVPLVPGEGGAPQWPRGVTGSMTHCEGYRACVLARTADFASIGLDAEPSKALPPGVAHRVTLPAEREHLAALARTAPGACWDRLLFCAKESVYKAWFPLTGRWLGFQEASIEFSADGTGAGGTATVGSFCACVLVPGPVTCLTGRWLRGDGHVLTLVTHPAEPCPGGP